jgi:predicted transcriptional regulator
MSESLLAMAKDLALAQIEAGHATPDNMIEMLNSTYATLQHLQGAEQNRPADRSAAEPVDWKKSITKHAVTCLECGASFKQLSSRHLRIHDMDGRLYRDKYGIPRAQSLSARDTLARRREIVRQSKPWEKSPTSPKAKQKAAATKKTRSAQGKGSKERQA